MPESRDRLTARKVRADDVLRGKFTKQEGFDPNYLLTPYGMRVSRARIIGTVVDRYVNDDRSYGALLIDDGTGTIRAKCFQDLDIMDDVEEGDIVEVIGKVKRYEGEMYVTPELIVAREPTYELLRALETHQQRERWQELVGLAEDADDEDDLRHELEGEGLTEQEIDGLLEYIDTDADFERAETAPAEPQDAGDEQAGDAPGDGERRKAVVDAIESLDEGDGAEYGAIEDETGIDEDALEDVINDLLSDGTCYEPRPGRIKRL